MGTAGNVKVVFCGSARKRKQAGTVMIYMDNAATTMRKPKEVIEQSQMQCSVWEMPAGGHMRHL